MNRPYTPFDIIWIKNVTNETLGYAYTDVDDIFTLHFPTKHEGNVLSPQLNEIILIYQNINHKRVFTHLVTPIDDIKIVEKRINHRYGRKVKVIAKTDLNNGIPISSTSWDDVNFQGISQGNACKISNISRVNNHDNLLADIWDKFIPFFKPQFQNSTSFTSSANIEIDNTDLEISVREGKLRLITHFARERDKNIIRIKKQSALKNNLLQCEVCNFSFINKFGIEFIECHHKKPISESGATETTLNDLGLVCANCHRMLHRKFDGHFLTMEQLRERLT